MGWFLLLIQVIPAVMIGLLIIYTLILVIKACKIYINKNES